MKTIPSSNHCRESLDISAAVFVVHVASARCAISNYLPVYTTTACTNNFFFNQLVMPPATRTSSRNNNDARLAGHYALELTFHFQCISLPRPLKKKEKKRTVHSTSRMKNLKNEEISSVGCGQRRYFNFWCNPGTSDSIILLTFRLDRIIIFFCYLIHARYLILFQRYNSLLLTHFSNLLAAHYDSTIVT